MRDIIVVIISKCYDFIIIWYPSPDKASMFVQYSASLQKPKFKSQSFQNIEW